ncbi:hypothetical protein Tco_0127719 [Tanacetum coccineum]
MTLCTSLQNKVLDLEHTKTTQALEIDSLKRRVKKLEKKQRYLVRAASKQGRENHDIEMLMETCTLEKVHDAEITIPVSAAKVLSDVNMTLAQALAKLKSVKPKAVTAATTTTTTALQVPRLQA